MAGMLPRPLDSAADYLKPASLTRILQLISALELTADALSGRGVLSGGAVTQAAAFTARLAAGTVYTSGGYTYTVPANIDAPGLTPSVTNYLWAKLARTAADKTQPTALDTYALQVTPTESNVAPSADHTILAIIPVGSGGITSIDDNPPGKYAVGSARMQDAIGGAPLLTAAAEASNARVVSIRARDLAGNNLAERRLLRILVSDTQYGEEAAAAPSGGVAVTTGRLVQTVTAGKQLLVETDATGLAQITVTEATAKTFWVTGWMDTRAGSVQVAFA